MNTEQNNSRIVFLDWLRIIAFVSVLVGHKYASMLLALRDSPTTHASLKYIIDFLFPLFEGGGAGVLLFFLVSGYIIAKVIYKEAPIDFLIRRFFRIYPLYIVAAVIEAALRFYHLKTFVGWGVFIQQLSLMGLFFDTPYTLSGVEWTLRIEVCFYVIIVLLKFGGFFDKKLEKYLQWVLVGIVIVLLLMAGIPGKELWNYGYVNLYAPFLILGVVYYLYEQRKVSLTYCGLLTGFVLVGHWVNMSRFQPSWLHSHFMLYGFLIFFFAWLFRKNMRISTGALFLSEMTYAVYLFHNWLYEAFVWILSKITESKLIVHIAALSLLLVFCWGAIILVERPAISLGRAVSRRVSFKRPKSSV